MLKRIFYHCLILSKFRIVSNNPKYYNLDSFQIVHCPHFENDSRYQKNNVIYDFRGILC